VAVPSEVIVIMDFARITLLALPLSFVLGGCPRNNADESFSRAEAQEALDESRDTTAADSLASASIEISTNFTIGSAVTAAAGEVRSFVQSQLPCADITLQGATLTVEYGVNPGNCVYRGHEFTGTHAITVEANDMSQVHVHHEWTGLSNGIVMLDGSADVTWDFAAKSRHVVHHAEWTHLSSGRTGVGEGDRTQTALSGGLAEGIQVAGTRSWTGPRGRWDLGIDDVEMRWVDPVPQAGSYTLVTPKEKTVKLSFARVDADTIAVTLTGPRGNAHTFNVNSL
jgi:hypothetical protein